MVDRSRETFNMDSSSAEVCSGEVPCLEGRRADGDSFSTCVKEVGYQYTVLIDTMVAKGEHRAELRPEYIGASSEERGATYSDLEIHHLLRESAHLIVEAEHVFSSLFCGEHRVYLPLLAVLHNDLAIGSRHAVVDVEGTA